MNPELSDKPTFRRSFLKKLLATAAGTFIITDKLKAENKGGLYPSPASGNEPYLGEIALFAFNFAPTGWAQCNGQIMSIAQNTALFSLLGTQYGGNGTSTFALPDLRGRMVISQGQGPGLSSYVQGQIGGEESHILLVTEMPQHSHSINCSSTVGNSNSPTSNYPAQNSEGILQYSSGSPDAIMNAGALSNAGGSTAHNNLQPYLVLNYCIALVGIFPPRP